MVGIPRDRMCSEIPGPEQDPDMPGNVPETDVGDQLALYRREIYGMAMGVHHYMGGVIDVNVEFLERILEQHRAGNRVLIQNYVQGFVNYVQQALHINVVEFAKTTYKYNSNWCTT